MAINFDARAAAAKGILGEVGDVPPELGVDLPAPDAGAGGDPESALLALEGALEGLDPSVAEEARQHVNAIREILARDPAAAEAAAPEQAAAPVSGELPPQG